MPFFPAFRRLLLRVAFVAIGVALGATGAAAHATLLETKPATDARLATSPDFVELIFDQPVDLVSVRAVNLDSGAAPASAGFERIGAAIRIRFDGPFAPGNYAIIHRTASIDGHPIQGTLRLGVGDPPTHAVRTLTGGDAQETFGWLGVAIFVRFVIAAIAVVVGGGFIYARLVAVPGATYRHLAPRLAWLGAVLSLLDIGVRAAFLADVPPLGIFDPALWRFGLSLDAGIARLASIPGFILLAFAWHFGASRALGLAGTALVILSLVGSSHASAPSPRWFGAGALALHLAAILFWFGAFVPLIGALTRKGGGASAEILRFAKLMIPALIVILVTGAALLFVQVGAIDALLASDYATPLGLKLVAIVIVLAFAARNKWIHTPLLHREPAHGAWALTRSIRFEAAVALGALAFATLLAFTAPPRVLIAAAPSSALHLDLAHAEGRTLIVAGGDAVAAVTLEPARIGANRLSIALSDADDLPLPGAVVSVVFALADGDRRVGPVALRDLGGGDYEFSDLDLPRAGLWRVTLTVDRPETNATTLETEVTLK